MDTYRKVYERTITRLLSHHVEEGIPDEADVWPLVRQRLARRAQAQPAEDPASGRAARVEPGTLPVRRPAPAPSRPPAGRASRLLGAAASMLGLLLLAGVSWLAISQLAQRQVKPGEGTPTVESTASALSTALPGEDLTFMFSIPVGDGGITYGDTYLSGFFAASPDGTFWAGSADYRLLHYSAEGALLGTIDIPSHEGYPSDMVTDGVNLWLLYMPEPGRTGPMTLYRVAPDGSKLAEYAFQITSGMNLAGLMLGEHGEALLRGSFYSVMMAVPATLTAAAPVIPVVPPPVPSTVPEVYPKPLLQLVDAQGNLAPKGLDGYSYGGKLYSWRIRSSILVNAGDVEVSIPFTNAPFSVNIAAVEPDGSFYVDVAEEEDTGGPYLRVYSTLYHYAADGRLIERARLPEIYNKLLTGPDGNFYVLMENPPWTERGGAPPNSVDIYRLNFVPADEPLPPSPTAISTFPVWTPEPAVTSTSEPGPDLDALVRKAEVIAQVRTFGYNEDGPDAVLALEVQKWLKNATGDEAKTLFLRVPADLWPQMPPWFHGTRDPMSNDGRNDTYIMFLSKGPGDPTYGQTYYLTGGRQGAFLILNGEIYDSAFPQYNGMSVEAFRRLVTGEPTPVPPVPAEITPTRAPNSPPVALVRDGEGFRLDVYEGGARFGTSIWPISGPWIGPSSLLLEWYSVPPDPNDTSAYSYTTYLVDAGSGTLTPLPVHEPNRVLYPSPDGTRAVMVWTDPIRIRLYDSRTGAIETVAHLDPNVPQWADAGAGIGDFTSGHETFSSAVPVWAGNDSFALTLSYGSEAGEASSHQRALLVDIPQKQVRMLAKSGSVLAAFSDGSVLVRSGRIDGAVQLFRIGGKSSVTTIAPSGLWRVSWSPSPDGKQVAWVEMDPPPGDWSNSLPHACCSGDPPPVVKGIAIWDRTSGEVQHLNIPDLAWSNLEGSWWQGDRLVWSKDGSSFYYATHSAEDGTTLFRLSSGSQPTPLVELDRRVGVGVVAEGNDGSIYYTMNGLECQFCVQLMRRYPDTRTEIIHPNSQPNDWYVDPYGHLLALNNGGVAVTDLASGHSSQVDFPGVTITRDTLAGYMLSVLVALAPDGRWAAYTKHYEYMAPTAPDGRPDYGRTVHIVRVK